MKNAFAMFKSKDKKGDDDEVDDNKEAPKKTKVTLKSSFTNGKTSKRAAKAARKKRAKAAFSGSDEPSVSPDDYEFDSTTPESKSSTAKLQVTTSGK